MNTTTDASLPSESWNSGHPVNPVQTPATPDPRQAILAALRSEKPAHSRSLTPLENDRVTMIYRRAVLTVCRAIEDASTPAELASAGVPLEELTPTHCIGEHLSATRRHFGLIP